VEGGAANGCRTRRCTRRLTARLTCGVMRLKEISACHQVVEPGFDSCDDATNDPFGTGGGLVRISVSGRPEKPETDAK
jgi:hypothetical protein